ncbi:immunoglobulin kappa light chain-like [Protopterus annectens]|uniref:immunoglobulin kappa light chain-like n=1 Tax=Protopterus annectens TaxID=7888 RepID=UPI001CF9B3C7|nr:immunoglobulin kappa light chain-like [Protopterus annectens]
MLSTVLLLFVCLSALKTDLVQQPGYMTAHLGESVNLTCRILTPSVACFDLVWYMQQHTEAPQRIDAEKRTIASEKIDNKNCTLKLDNLKKSDSGKYYCSMCRDSTCFTGKGTKLIVSDRTVKKPTIIISVPPQDNTPAVAVTLVCLVYDLPPHTLISWNVSGKEMAGKMSSGMITIDGDYIVMSELKIPTEIWNKKTYIMCKAGTDYTYYYNHLKTTGKEDCTWNRTMCIKHTHGIEGQQKEREINQKNLTFDILRQIILLLTFTVINLTVFYQIRCKEHELLDQKAKHG